MGAGVGTDGSAVVFQGIRKMFLSLSEEMLTNESTFQPSAELSVSFEYQCQVDCEDNFPCFDELGSIGISRPGSLKKNSSFSCLSGAALSANATLANTNILNGRIGEEILPVLDSPNSFRPVSSSPSLSRLDLLSSAPTNIPAFSGVSPENDFVSMDKDFSRSMSIPASVDAPSFLNAMVDTRIAGGAAGEDRVQAICSKENGWLFCGVYDGFNGRDAADFLAVCLYESIGFGLHLLQQQLLHKDAHLTLSSSLQNAVQDDFMLQDCASILNGNTFPESFEEKLPESFHQGVMDCLRSALAQAENDFLHMVEQEMEERPYLVCVGSCVLIVLLYGKNLYILNIGDSRAVLATVNESGDGILKALQLSETHTVANEAERSKLLSDHPDDSSTIVQGRVKGKLKLTRAFGVGYLKKEIMNDALMGIIRVRNLLSPPYVSTEPFVMSHRVLEDDLFIVIGSDGLFDFFTNSEVVHLVYLFIRNNPCGDPAKYLLEELLSRAALKAGMTKDELTRVPAGRRRKYHDDVTVIVIMLGNKQRATTATTL